MLEHVAFIYQLRPSGANPGCYLVCFRDEQTYLYSANQLADEIARCQQQGMTEYIRMAHEEPWEARRAVEDFHSRTTHVHPHWLPIPSVN